VSYYYFIYGCDEFHSVRPFPTRRSSDLLGGPGLGPRTFAAVAATLAEADASVAMVYLMHILGVATIRSARPSAAKGVTPLLQEEIGRAHVSTLAFSEPGSRSHFWAPMSRARRNG